MKLKHISTLLVAVFISMTGITQTIGVETAAYINQFKNIAMQEQIRTGVPAAIKLGQAILESQTGKSRLATEANNHFGIKCKTEWRGPKIYHNDDANGECFRVYDNAEASFIDHSNFLKTRTHYAFLFKLDVRDFTSWAFGLKQAGYATNPNYPAQLIKAINDYDLAQYTLIAIEQKKKGIDFVITPAPTKELPPAPAQATDTTITVAPVVEPAPTKEVMPASLQQKDTPITVASVVQPAPTKEQAPAPVQQKDTQNTVVPVVQPAPTKEVIPSTVSLLENTKVTINHTRGILAIKGSSLLAIANQQKISLSKLFEYNELAEMNILDQDRILFVEKKQKYGASEVHTTQGAETLYSIAQKEGVQLSTILTLNPSIAKDSILPADQKIRLRAEAVPKTGSKKSKKGKKK
jgi:LysM repeat protein